MLVQDQQLSQQTTLRNRLHSKHEILAMEFIDTHSVVIFGVLLVHLMGVIVVAASAVALVAALFVVVLAVHGYRNMWSARRPGKQGRSGDDLAAQRL